MKSESLIDPTKRSEKCALGNSWHHSVYIENIISRIISSLHLELFSVNAKRGKGNVYFNCKVTKPVTWFSEIYIARLILGFENFALNYSIS